ncbi:MAG TPA: hypothetical protein VG497_01920 [Kribbella sp.]|nr:hypothetical protein [Kribbella sp.]
MTEPNGTSVALQYVREELNALGQRMHTELAALRGEVGQLATAREAATPYTSRAPTWSPA